MRLSERLLLVAVGLCCVWGEGKKDTSRGGRHFLALLGYIHGYKLGQEYASKYPSYLITPIVILPSVNQQQSVNIQQGNTDENYQENGGIVQVITHDKILSSLNGTATNKNITNPNTSSDDIEVIVMTTIKPSTFKDEDDKKGSESVTESLRQSLTSTSNTTTKPSQIITTTVTNNITVSNHSNKENNSSIKGPYPSPTYNNTVIDSINITTSIPVDGQEQALPPITDNRWQNFTLRANLSNIMSDDNMTMINEQLNNTLSSSFPIENVTEYPKASTTNEGPYTKAWYYNPAIDQLSITTNYYTNESPSAQSDGWGSNSVEKEILPSQLSGFQPLAGLYYDRFLHRPLKKIGFLPKNYWN